MKRAMMVDLETLGTSTRAVFPVLGWCAFDYDPHSVENIGHSGDIVINPQDCIDIGMDVDWSTIHWWMQQEEAARQVLGNPGKVQSLQSALERFTGYYRDFGCEEIWSRGNDFDIAILRTAYRLSKMELPWDFRTARDVRTYLDAAEFEKGDIVRPDSLEKHVASHDAIWQAKTVIHCSERFAAMREE